MLWGPHYFWREIDLIIHWLWEWSVVNGKNNNKMTVKMTLRKLQGLLVTACVLDIITGINSLDIGKFVPFF